MPEAIQEKAGLLRAYLAMTDMKRGMTTLCHSGNFVQRCARLSGIQTGVMDEENGDSAGLFRLLMDCLHDLT
ncbi:MAG: hypothetical protein A2103_03010 [Gammaproteobacteria bacterium GWF2_41_13]|nr:MAG: hypothetical protein A2103_03010 [Gammaproteobacteria bacterium GWF2_41_13]